MDVKLPPTLTNDDRRIVELMRAEGCDWTYKCFEAALTHLQFAHRLVEVDSSMAIFRAITAEEEAATGLLRALKLRKYLQADQLRVRDHVHKAAVYPFLLAVVKLASHLKFDGVKAIRLAIPKSGEHQRLTLALVLNGEMEGQVARPTPPLNFQYREGVERTPPDYRRYFVQLLEGGDYSDIRKYLEAKANERNFILYASQQGLPEIANISEDYLVAQKSRVMTIMKAALLVWPYHEIQPFAQEAVVAFASVVQRLKKEPVVQ